MGGDGLTCIELKEIPMMKFANQLIPTHRLTARELAELGKISATYSRTHASMDNDEDTVDESC